MSIDASIALQGKLPQFDNPLTQYGQMAQIQSAQQQNRLADLAYGEKQREVNENRLLGEQYKGSIGADGAIDRNKLYTGLAGAGLGAKLPGIQKGFADQDKAALDATKAKLEAGLKHFEVVGQIMSGVKDQASYDIARQQAAQIFGPEAAAKLPAAYDPAVIEQNRQQAMSVKDQLEQQWKALDYKLNVGKAGEVVRHNTATERTAAGQLGVAQGQLGVAQGNLGVNQAREAREASAPKGQYDAERGVLVDPRTGIARQVTGADGQPIAPKDKPLTETQGKATGFAARAQQADKLISSLDYSPAAINSKASVENTPMVGGMLGALVNSTTLSASDQRAEQAQRDFINAVLRQESGAAIGKDEFNNARKQYFTQPGDDADTIKQKATNRKLAVEALRTQAGPGAKQIDGMVETSNKPAAKRVEEAVKNGEGTKLANANAKPVSVKSAADYAKLPPGTVYTAPDGSQRTKQ